MHRSCDTMVALGTVTMSGQTLFAKNSDRPADECQPLVQQPRLHHEPGALTRCQYVTVPDAPITYRHVGSRPRWCWGYEHGFNEHQVVIGNEGLGSRLSHDEPKLVGMELVRLGLERGRTAAEAVDVITNLVTQYGQGVFTGGPPAGSYDNGFLVADPGEAYAIETAGHHWAVKQVENTLGISNVYALHTDWITLSPSAHGYACDQGWWRPEQGRLDFAATYSREGYGTTGRGCGALRRARSCAVLTQRSGHIDAPTMMTLLSDHTDGTDPTAPIQSAIPGGGGICFHYHIEDGVEHGGNTAASLVADLCADGSRLAIYWCSFYSPCLGVFLPLFVEGTLPSVLSIGTEIPCEQSPWWLFHRLSRLVRARPESRVPLVRKQCASLQQRFFESAVPIAREGRQLLDNGQSAVAYQILTDYMDTKVTDVLSWLRHTLDEIATV